MINVKETVANIVVLATERKVQEYKETSIAQYVKKININIILPQKDILIYQY